MYSIVRLPNVIGHSKNPFTLTNYLYNAIQNEIEFKVFDKATRYFMYIVDVKRILTLCINKSLLQNKIYELTYPFAFRIHTIVSLLEKIIGKPAKYTVINKGSQYKIENSEVFLNAFELNEELSLQYFNSVLYKYYFVS
jgi:nucleoside-diphosphate-sugar epimerase